MAGRGRSVEISRVHCLRGSGAERLALVRANTLISFEIGGIEDRERKRVTVATVALNLLSSKARRNYQVTSSLGK
mgnify:CR=1 FL=1